MSISRSLFATKQMNFEMFGELRVDEKEKIKIKPSSPCTKKKIYIQKIPDLTEAVAQFEKKDGCLYTRQENLFNLRLV
jgi:hypothetical protein